MDFRLTFKENVVFNKFSGKKISNFNFTKIKKKLENSSTIFKSRTAPRIILHDSFILTKA